MTDDGTIPDLAADEIDALIARGEPLLVQIWASWCGPCKAMLPVLEALAPDFAGGLTIVRLETGNDDKPANDAWTKPFGVRSVPTFILFDKGADIAGFAGTAEPAQLRSWLDGHLAGPPPRAA